MDSTAQTAPRASEIITETASTGDAWIRQRKEPMWALKSSTKTESLQDQKSSTKTESLRLKNHQRNCFHG
jgi:hypothetical protein